VVLRSAGDVKVRRSILDFLIMDNDIFFFVSPEH